MTWLRTLVAAGVRNPVYANMLMVCMLSGGLGAAWTLVRETYPEFSLDRISIETAYPGAGPQEVEQSVSIRVEEALEGLPGIKLIWSRSAENGSLTMVELTEDADPDRLILDIKDRVGQITGFPEEVEQPVVTEVLTRGQVINVAIHGPIRERALKDWALEVRDELLGTDAVTQIAVTGIRDDEISIHVSPEALLRYDLSIDEIAALVARNTVDLPAGTLRTRNEELTLRTAGQRYTAQEFEDLVVIARPDGTLIRLGQIATIRDAFAEDFKSGRFQGQPAAILEIYKTPEHDTSVIAHTVREYVARKRAELPPQVQLDVWADSSEEVDARIGMLVDNGAMGMILVVVVLTLFLDFRVSLYVALGIPVSFAGALIVMHFLGETLNMITLLGLIMVTGIIVDDAIVVADGFRMKRGDGVEPQAAAIEGTLHVGLPVLASSLTTVLAFAPLFFVMGIMGKFIAVLPVVVVAAIVFSSVEAFCILPSHLQHCLHGNGHRTGAMGAIDRVRGAFDRGTDRFIAGVYRPICERCTKARGLVLSACLAMVLLTGGLVLGGRVPFTLLPEIDGSILMARARFPPGVPVERTREAARRLEAAALRLNDRAVLPHAGDGDLVLKTFSIVGEWSGWVDESGSHLCEVMIELLPAEKRGVDGDVVMAAWQKACGRIDDAVAVSFDQLRRGPAEKPLEIRLLGDDLDVLEEAAEEVTERLEGFAGVSGVEHDLTPGKREIRVRLKPLARTLGVSVEDLARQLRSAFYGGEAVRVQRGGEEVRVQVRYPEEQRKGVSDIENMRIRAPDGQELAFLELADYTIAHSPSAIYRQNGKRRVRVRADVDEHRANAEQILAELDAGFLPSLPERYPGLSYRIEGQHAQMVESLRSLFAGLGFALIAIYAVLGSMLRSYMQPAIIMAAVPIGFVGAIAGHGVMGYDLTIMSVFGMVAISGVVVNDSLVLLDEINRRVREGRPVLAGVCESGEVRFRAVMLTSVTTIAGLAPLLFERSTQAQSLIPMVISLTFGLLMATVLTLLVVPCLYVAVNDVRRLARWLRRGGAYPSAEALEAAE